MELGLGHGLEVAGEGHRVNRSAVASRVAGPPAPAHLRLTPSPPALPACARHLPYNRGNAMPRAEPAPAPDAASRVAAELGLPDALRARLPAGATKAELEDLYLPFRPKKRTRAALARDKGLGPLADLVLAQPSEGDVEAAASPFVDPAKELADTAAVLAGARD